MVTPLDADTWQESLESFNGLSVVKFYAPWCRTCRSIQAPFKSIANELEAASPNVRFFEVDFKQNKALCLRERVFMIPSIHFYTSALGCVNRFTVKGGTVSSRVREEVDRYVGESDHLGLLQSLHSTALNPMVRYVDLVSVMQALSQAPTFKASAVKAGDMINEAVATPERLEGLERLFSLLDANDDGVLDEAELAAVAAAVAPPGTLGAGEYSATELLQRCCQLDPTRGVFQRPEGGEEGGEAEASAGASDEEPVALPVTREAFVRMMTSKAATEFGKPKQELLPAFQALDKDGDGTITRGELTSAMERLTNFNLVSGDTDDMEASSVIFDALDVDKSGSVDYEEFVAMLSGWSPSAPEDVDGTARGVDEALTEQADELADVA